MHVADIKAGRCLIARAPGETRRTARLAISVECWRSTCSQQSSRTSRARACSGGATVNLPYCGNMNWDFDALWSKAKYYYRKALSEPRDSQDFGLFCALALEFVGRASLAKLHP